MPDRANPARIIAVVESAADDAAALAERMFSIGAWGAYAALSQLAREREARAERLHERWCRAVTGRAHAERLAG